MRYTGDRITCEVYANTGGSALAAFTFHAYFNTSLLSFLEIRNDAKYTQPKVYDNVQGQVVSITSGVEQGVEDVEVTGDGIPVASVDFMILASAPEGLHTGVLSCTVVDMISATGELEKQEDAQINDMQGGNMTTAMLQLAHTSVRGIYAIADSSELFNTLSFASAQHVVNTSITVWQYLAGATTEDSIVEGVVQCTVQKGSDAVDVEAVDGGCFVSCGKQHVVGAEEVLVEVQVNGTYTTTVSLRVWFPQSVTVISKDRELNAIHQAYRGCDVSSGSSSPLYQQTQMYAYTTFAAGALETAAVDVSCMVEFRTSDSSVVLVDGDVAKGISLGSASISAYGSSGTELSVSSSRYDLQVAATEVTVHHLSAVMVTGADFAVHDSSPGLNLDDSWSSTANVTQELRMELVTGHIFVYVEYSDSTIQEVRSVEGSANVTVEVHKNYPLSIGVTKNEGLPLNQGPEFEGMVLLNAQSLEADDLLVPRWVDVCTGMTVAEGMGYVNVDLLKPVSMTVTAQDEYITRDSDKAALAPISVPVSSALNVTVFYEDGSSRDFSQDERIAIEIMDGLDLIQVSGNMVSPLAATANSTFGTAMLLVTLGSYSAGYGLSATVEVSVVGLERVVLRLYASPEYDGSHEIEKYTYRRNDCNGHYQPMLLNVTAKVFGMLDVDVTMHSTFTVGGNITILDEVEGEPIAPIGIPKASGNHTIMATFEGCDSEMVTANVIDENVQIVGMEFRTDWGSWPPTFLAYKSTTRALRVSLNMSDGTKLEDVVPLQSMSDPTLGTAPLLVKFSSSHPEVVKVTEQGYVTLLDNYGGIVEITATAMDCVASSSLESKEYVFANLIPMVHDVDIGNEVGAALSGLDVNDVFTLPVRVEVGNNTLNLFHFIVKYDAESLLVEYCDPTISNTSWSPTIGMLCTINDPPGEVHMSGVEIRTEITGLVSIADIGFKAIGDSTSPLYAVIEVSACAGL
ncbi:hypothetical protein CYMTET_25040 [Cymbomonas tetramitiformis]|uniref:Uncharacterized protein n=1 Tax=Cymbomonas tetramitiformis TaxID=36881 RepID=A0AAE0KZK7_9CHLO|nr:hypothetical protein CYMTET_25040 [Cymbomonas tetramitiformis]